MTFPDITVTLTWDESTTVAALLVTAWADPLAASAFAKLRAAVNEAPLTEDELRDAGLR
jgi:hypothetical protein